MRRWTLEEFEVVHSHPELSAQELSELLPGRTVGAIEATRGGIDQFLNGRPVAGLLTQRAVRRLEELYPDVAARH